MYSATSLASSPARLTAKAVGAAVLFSLVAAHANAAEGQAPATSVAPPATNEKPSPIPAEPAPDTGGWLNFGNAPADISPAPKNTQLGRDVLEYIAPDPFDQGRIIFNTRLRYESATQTGLQDSNAITLRTRIGYETPKWHGLYALGEFENMWAVNYTDYGAFPPPFNNGKTVIADPRNNQLNQAYIGYTGYGNEFKAGRQVINLDNQRYVGAVDWRQNDQTYDAIRLNTEVVRDLWVSYAWDWQVNRIFGADAPTETLRRFDSNNHFLNVHYNGLSKYGVLGAYMYYLDLDGVTAPRVTSAGTQPLSSVTPGLYFDGRYALDSDWALLYRAEFAYQTDNYATGKASFSETYNHVVFGGAYKKFEAGAAYEKLGGDGTRAFQTPLATLHKFNGWADQFLTTPAAGLRDYYLWARTPLLYDVNLTSEVHYFTATNTSRTYGREFDIGVSRKFGSNVTVGVKFAQYWGNGAPQTGLRADVTKIWLQVEFGL